MLPMTAAAVALLLAPSAAGMASPQGAWILKCDMASPAEAAAGVRTYRLGRNLFQEWKPDTKAFGPNLCLSFACKADSDRLEGVLSAATLTLTISLNPQTSQASWRTVGATQLGRSSGVCSAAPDTTAAATSPP
jgi:hypothetical protein